MDEDLRFVYKHYRRPVLHHSVPEGTETGKIEQTYKRNNFISIFIAYHYTRGESKWEPAIYGGLTICYVYRGDEVVAIGEAQCSLRDQFCYRIGRMIARGRALKELEKCQRKSASTK